MSYFEYLFTHCIPTGFQSFRRAFYFWIKLLQGDISDYAFYKEKFNDTDEDLFQMVRESFWAQLEDDVLPKEFLEGLMQQVEDINNGTIELHTFRSFDEVMKELDEIEAENDYEI